MTTTMMKTEPTPSDREVLTGLVERVTYQNAENGFCVVPVIAVTSYALGSDADKARAAGLSSANLTARVSI
jgi:hypothetical protein